MTMRVSNFQILFKNKLNRVRIRTLFTKPQDYKLTWSNNLPKSPTKRTKSGTSTESRPMHNSSSNPSHLDPASKDGIKVIYRGGLPQITVPLPSRRDRCRFTLRPVTNTVGDFLAMLRVEDKGVDRAACTTGTGVRIAASDSIEALLEQPFVLIVNDRKYEVDPPPRERLTSEESADLADVRDVVQRLYEALEVRERRTRVERDLVGRIENVRMQLQPMERHKLAIDMQSDTSTRYLVWLGLGLMGVQFGVLARLTWWEYSWDIMEPVTYFVTYGTTMMCYAYYVLTKQEPNMPDVRDRQYLITFHKKAKRSKFDVQKYNKLKEDMYELEKELFKLRDPLLLHSRRKFGQSDIVEPRKVHEDAGKSQENVPKDRKREKEMETSKL